MTVQEAIKHYKHGITHDIFKEPVTTYAKLAIESMEEVEQYRVLGTPKEIKIREVSSAQLGKAYLSNLTELREYQSLGTVEELKEAREKQVAVKHHHTRVDNIIDKVRKSVCPKCLGLIYTHQEEYPNYCTNCGQRINWSEEDD